MLSEITIYCLCFWLIADSTWSTLSCDFEYGLCEWQQSRDNQFDWRVINGSSPDATSGPMADHTTGHGRYAYIFGEDAANRNSHGIIISPLVNVSSHTSLSFWYFMNGNGIGTLTVRIAPFLGAKNLIWTISGRQGNQWIQEHILLPVGLYQIEFDATAAHHAGADLAIDDITVLPEPEMIFGMIRPTPSSTTMKTTKFISTTGTVPTTTPRSKISLACAFERDFCVWRQDTGDDFDWRRLNQATADHSSGPLRDHTSGSGYFAYIRGADTKHQGESARLITPFIEAVSPSEMSFWYHMNGGGIGALRVVRTEVDGSTSVLFTVTGRQGPDWNHGQFTLQPGMFKLAIEATSLLHYGSDIAIDDILSNTFYVASLAPTSTATTHAATTTAALPITCTFEAGTCGWSQYGITNLDWTRATGKSPDFVSGPSADHTTGNGYYMLLDSRHAGQIDWNAEFISPDLDLQAPATLTFWYFMNGPNIGSLTVQTLKNGAVSTIWQKTGRQDSVWLEATVALPSGTYKLLISGTAQHYYGGDLAVDDISLTITH